jgi:cellulose synthase/poly-beta-1,6-N-acetylglucosamine synthase-like glycosyltransferase
MPYNSLIFDALFTLSVTLIWFMLGYQSLLFFLGHLYHRRTRGAKHPEPLLPDDDLPYVSVMVPCHNEERVIAHTIRALQALDYPPEKLEFLMINDGSTDNTAEVVLELTDDPRVRLLNVPADIAARGKAGALNYALSHASYDVLAIYDADNMPEPGAIRPLASRLAADPKLVAAVGMYRAWNRHRSLLTSFLNIEGIGFQWILQAGRWMLMRLTMLPGTNYVIRRSIVEQLGGWDPSALAEDAELSTRIYQAGGEIQFVPASVSWEQEPERLGNWFRQRRRWVRGNNYVLRKWGLSLLRPNRVALEMLYSLVLYYLFFLAVLVSDVLFLLSATGVISIHLPGPYTVVWMVAYATFVFQLVIALSCEKGEDTGKNILLTALMYFTYCQLWIPVVAAALYDDIIVHREMRWAKTERYLMDTVVR